MTVTTWNQVVIDGKNYLVIDVAKFRIPLDWDPSSNMFIAVSAPDGGLGNFPALQAGQDGVSPTIDQAIAFTPIAYADPTAEYAYWTLTAPNVYKLNLGLRRGPAGANAVTTILPSSYSDTPLAGQLLRVKADLSGFELFTPRQRKRYLPATLANVPTGNPAYTICAVPIDAQPYDQWVTPVGQCQVTGTGADVRVDLIARLSTAGVTNGETAGPEVARAIGQTGVNPATHVLSAARPPGSAATYGKILAGNTATVYFRTERQAGANTYSTLADTTRFEVWTDPA